MYRLSEMKDDLVQRLVSNEIIRGFGYVFGADEVSLHFDEESFDNFIICSEVLSELVEEKPEARTALAAKLCITLQAVRDRDYEYTFDEFGEFLLYEMICYADDGEAELFWEPGGTWFERNELRQMVKDLTEDFYAEGIWDNEQRDPEATAQEIESTVRAITCFPRLADELKGNNVMPFLFGDTDFMLFYDEKFDRVIDFMREDWDCGFSGGKMTKGPLKEEEPKDGEEKK